MTRRAPLDGSEEIRLGVDFDNTLICYDGLFHRVALEQGLVPAKLPATKEAVRDHLRAAGREDDWTRLQGVVYGERIDEARPFPGALETLAVLARAGVQLAIISHKTRRPYLSAGPPADLHAAARRWIEASGLLDPAGVGLRPEQVQLAETREEKLRAIARTGCTHFLDDLPEVLLAPGFPPATARLLFAPGGGPRTAAAGLRTAATAAGLRTAATAAGLRTAATAAGLHIIRAWAELPAALPLLEAA